MVITPILRGLFGIDIDATTKTITVNPHLPAGWDSAEVMDLQLPGEKTALYFKRHGDHLEVYMSPTDGDAWHLRSDIRGATFGPLAGEISQKVAHKIRLELHQGLRIPPRPWKLTSRQSTLAMPLQPTRLVSRLCRGRKPRSSVSFSPRMAIAA